MLVVCFLAGLLSVVLLPSLMWASYKLPKKYKHLEKSLKAMDRAWSLSNEIESKHIVTEIKGTRMLLVIVAISAFTFCLSALASITDLMQMDSKPTYQHITYEMQEGSGVVTMLVKNCHKLRFNSDICEVVESKSLILSPKLFKE